MPVMALVRRVCPLSHRAYVDVDKLASWIVSDAAGFEGLGCVAEQRGGDAGNAQIDGLGDDVLGVFCGVRLPTLAQFVVRFLRAVAGEDIDDAVGFAELGEHGVQDVEGAGIVFAYFFVMTVAQKAVELGEGLGDVGVANAVDDIDHLAGMAVGELQLIFLAIGGQVFFVFREQAYAGQGNAGEGVRDGVKPGVLTHDGLAGAGSGNDYAEKGDHRERSKFSG